MALSVLDRIPVDQISAEARQMRPGRAAMTLIAGMLFMLGWAVAKIITVSWLVISWSAAAVKVGWQEGRRSAVSRGAA